MNGSPSFILSAGMPRSGSTWLYNVIRLLIISKPVLASDLVCGWIGDFDSIPAAKVRLIKIHNYDKNLVRHSDCIIYSYRDIRDAIASSCRMFDRTPSVQLADHFINQYTKWMALAKYTMRYETMLHQKEKIIKEVSEILKIKIDDPLEIMEAVGNMNYNNRGKKNDKHHLDNLYHPNHITDGRHGSWDGILSKGLIQKIEKKYANWFEINGYPLST